MRFSFAAVSSQSGPLIFHRPLPCFMQSTSDGDVPTSSAAQPVPAITLPLLTSAFAGREEEHQVKRLLADMECVLAWQRSTSASHKVRDAMERVASQWHVLRKEKGRKRKPERIARELEAAILQKARRMLDRSNPFGSAAPPASSGINAFSCAVLPSSSEQTASFKRKLEADARAD